MRGQKMKCAFNAGTHNSPGHGASAGSESVIVLIVVTEMF